MIRASLILVLLLSAQNPPQPQPPSQDAWRTTRGARSPQRIAAGQMRMLTRAYELTDAQKEWLRQEMDRRAEAALKHDVESAAAIKQIQEKLRTGGMKPGESSRLIREQNERDPLKLETVVAALEPQLTPEQRTAGAAKLKELVAESQNRMFERDRKRKAAQSELARSDIGAGGIEPVMPPEKPLKQKPDLRGKAIDKPAAQSVEPRAAERKTAPTSADAGKAGGAAASAPPRLPTPPRGNVALGDWQKLMKDIAARYQFTEDQNRTAQAIYTDMEKRADTYRTVHADEYARITLIKDAKEAAARKAVVDQPLAAMEQELRERLESIPTGAQRAAAASAAPAGKSRK